MWSPLDWLRLRLLHAAKPLSSRLAARRAERVAVVGVVSILVALIGTALVPLWMLALGPIVLGVPHVLADLRYCVVRPGFHRRPALWLGVGVPLVMVAVSSAPAVGFAAVAGACVAADGSRVRRCAGVGVAIAAALACWFAEHYAGLILVHAHNLVAVLLWWRWRDGPLRAVPLAAFGLGLLLIAGGALDHSLAAASGPLGGELRVHAASLAPGLDGVVGLRLVLSYCFAQSVHYAMWLRLVPEDDRARPTPRSFVASWRALVDELGLALPLLAGLAALVLAGAATVDLAAARLGYLRAAQFHVFLELALLASLWVGGRRFVIDARPRAQACT